MKTHKCRVCKRTFKKDRLLAICKGINKDTLILEYECKWGCGNKRSVDWLNK